MFETIFTGEHGFFRVWVMDKETGVIHELLESRHYEFTDIKSDEHVDFPGGPVVKNPPASAGDARDSGSIPGSGRSSGVGNGNPLQYSCLDYSLDSRA